MEQTIVLSSFRAREVNPTNTPSDFTTVFERPLVLDKQHTIGLDKITTMTYSWYNISPEHKNTLIHYKKKGGDAQPIEFSPGNYSYKDINEYIKEVLVSNGDLEPNESSPIQIEFDLATFKCLVSLTEDYTLDLRDSNFGSLIGFESKVVSQTEFGSMLPNITNSIDALYVHCDLVSNSIVDGGYSDVLYVISTANLRRSYSFQDEPMRVAFCEMNRTIINSIRIYITDPTGKIVNLNGIDTSFRLIIKAI